MTLLVLDGTTLGPDVVVKVEPSLRADNVSRMRSSQAHQDAHYARQGEREVKKHRSEDLHRGVAGKRRMSCSSS